MPTANPPETYPLGEPPDWVPEWVCISCGEPLAPGKDVCDKCLASSVEDFTRQQGNEPPPWIGETESGDA